MSVNRPRLVVLDGHTCNPGDLSWEPLERLGTLTVHARTAPSELAARCAEADVLITNKTPLTAETLAAAPQLRGIVVLATGYDVVDTQAAEALQLPVCNVPEYGTAAVAQAVFALLLELTNHTGQLAAAVAQGRWQTCPDFCFWDRPLLDLEGLTLGVVGMGRIGRAVARIGEAFGMTILSSGRQPGPQHRPLEQLLAGSDVVSLHCPLTPTSRHLINARHLALMRPTAILINTGRGALVQEQDLAQALQRGTIAAAALDVLSVEPPTADNPLLQAPNCLITPHVAWASVGARRRLIAETAANVEALLAGHPRHLVPRRG
ncbi:MAG: D-2-hydroxyacid dehydrogenase [Synechococcaceae cyanobacterium]|nr:D-2-hydroxyacid dehydrogenase [Synechococcaceae cyanobacterium]